ncbi:hypothetical protein AAG906_000021 [Vitis piasezkii]
MTKELKDDYSIDDPVIDIAKLFGTPTMSGEFSRYVIHHHLSPAIFKRRREIKNPTKRKKLRKEIEKPLTSFDHLRPISEEALESFQKWISDDQGSTIDIDYMHIDKKWFQSLSNHGSWLADTPLYSIKWPNVDIVYVPINVRATLTLIICVPCSGDCGMFVIKYVEYLMHNHPLKSLTSARMDWFREKMAAELFYMKYLPM